MTTNASQALSPSVPSAQLVAALATLALLTFAGCGAMSEAAYMDLESQVNARNVGRAGDAVAALEVEGFVFVDDSGTFAMLDDASHERCLGARHEPSAADEAPVTLTVRRHGTNGVERADERTAHEAPFAEACAFFRGDPATLSLSGDHLPLRRVTGRVARAPDGTLIFVHFVRRVVATHRVLVERSCDHMPTVEPDPLERGPDLVRVLALPEAPAVREVSLEVEEVDVRCTENTY